MESLHQSQRSGFSAEAQKQIMAHRISPMLILLQHLDEFAIEMEIKIRIADELAESPGDDHPLIADI
jgi:hypothetical protein